MLSILFVLASSARAAEPTLRILFPNTRGELCSIALESTPKPDDPDVFVVTELRVPGLPRAPRRVRKLLRALEGRHGDARRLGGIGLGNYAEHAHDRVLEGVSDSDDPVFARARSLRSNHELAVVRAALAFVRGETPGRAYLVDAITPMKRESAVQGQGLLLLLPDETYPHGVVTSPECSLPTWRPLANLRWAYRDAAILRPARIEEATREPSIMAVPPLPGPSFVVDDTFTLEFLDI